MRCGSALHALEPLTPQPSTGALRAGPRLTQEHERAKQAIGRVDPTVNLAADAGEHFASGGWGTACSDDGRDPASAAARRGGSRHDSIARDLNRHAAVVLQGAPEGLADELEAAGVGGGAEQQADTGRIATALASQQKAAAAAAAAAAEAAQPGGAGGGSGVGNGSGGDNGGVPAEVLEEWRQRAAPALEDLAPDDSWRQLVPLTIQDPRAYHDFDSSGSGGTPVAAEVTAVAGKAKAAAAPGGGGGGLLAALAAIQPLALPDPPVDPQLSSTVLVELGQEQDEALVAEFGPVAASALRFPPQDRARGLQPLLLVRRWGGCPCKLTIPWQCACSRPLAADVCCRCCCRCCCRRSTCGVRR